MSEDSEKISYTPGILLTEIYGRVPLVMGPNRQSVHSSGILDSFFGVSPFSQTVSVDCMVGDLARNASTSTLSGYHICYWGHYFEGCSFIK